MLTDTQIEQVKRLRRLCYGWDEIAAKTGLTRTRCFNAVRRKSKATLRREAVAIKRREQIRMMRRHIEHLEQKLRSVGVHV